MITLKTLKWSNCFSYGEDNEIDLSSTRLTQILGSNGVGKSSIPLILEEVPGLFLRLPASGCRAPNLEQP